MVIYYINLFPSIVCYFLRSRDPAEIVYLFTRLNNISFKTSKLTMIPNNDTKLTIIKYIMHALTTDDFMLQLFCMYALSPLRTGIPFLTIYIVIVLNKNIYSMNTYLTINSFYC